jgi:hypothetical protein
MRKFKLWLVFICVLLAAAPLQGGVCLAEENNYTLQYITTIAGGTFNYLGYLQGISGFTFDSYSDNGLVNIGFNNVDITGVYNRNIGIGSFRNQGSVALINIEPDLQTSPVIFSGYMFSQGNKVTVGDYNYAVKMNFNGIQGSGIVILDAMAGSFSNQFTSLTVNIGKNAISSTPLDSIFKVTQANGSTVVSLTNKQMQAIAATADNDFNMQGKQSAVAAIEGVPNIQGICATTLSAGVNNQVSHNVSLNIDTAK